MEPFVIRGERVELSVPTHDDVDRIAEVCSDAAVQEWTTVPSPYTRDDAVGFVENVVGPGWARGTEHTWALRERGRLVGMVGLNLDPAVPRVSAEIGYWLAPQARGRGLMGEAATLVVDWALDPEGLDAERLVWRAEVGNWSSRRVAWRLGFRVEGQVRGFLTKRGVRVDGWIGTLLAGDARTPAEPWPDGVPTVTPGVRAG
ncbi:GNAT family N-acetyltransferase [Cellulomonas sp. PhB143]|uniref:GNAT family N-acetyltransferase n=1 Tax=Cellulomonas sp. PhB143 TaxID=2485186 RepID=UPI000F48B035|nr:GNAT family N-acetyltransferase [Cellulomonas sp. PhB143]